MRQRTSTSGRRFLVLVLLLALVAGIVDLNRPNSLLQSAWRTLFPSQTRMERLRDEVMQTMPGNRQ